MAGIRVLIKRLELMGLKYAVPVKISHKTARSILLKTLTNRYNVESKNDMHVFACSIFQLNTSQPQNTNCSLDLCKK